MAERTRPGYCAGHYIRLRRKNVPADTIYQGTSLCWECVDRATLLSQPVSAPPQS
jgi:hypothetical protein